MMTIRGDMEPWIIDAIQRHRGKASVVAIARDIWEHHRREIEEQEDAFYTWQYDLRWAGQTLQKNGVIKKHRNGWELLRHPNRAD